jgi:hypothetical protein
MKGMGLLCKYSDVRVQHDKAVSINGQEEGCQVVSCFATLVLLISDGSSGLTMARGTYI